MGLISEAHGQTAEATKAAVDAGNVLLQYQVLGAACVFLILAVCVLFWLLIRSYDRNTALAERVIASSEASNTATEDNADALKEMRGPIAAIITAIQTLSREIEGESREVRHGLDNIRTGLEGIAKRLERERS